MPLLTELVWSWIWNYKYVAPTALENYENGICATDRNWKTTPCLVQATRQARYDVPDRMDFYISGDYARGHSIELIPQVNGNLETPPMKAEDW